MNPNISRMVLFVAAPIVLVLCAFLPSWATFLLIISFAKALVVMPGGFGTLDELFETLTLRQTGKIKKPMPVVLFGKEYWSSVINFEALVEHGTIDAKDLELFFFTESVDEAFDFLTEQLSGQALQEPGIKL